MEQVFRQLQDSKVPQPKPVEVQLKTTPGIDLELAQARFELALEKKLTEIVQLKAELQKCRNDLQAAQRQASLSANAQVYNQISQQP